MQQNGSDVVVLKPTAAFLSYLETQLPDMDFPSLRLLRRDPTAYTLAKQNTEEETLNEIERLFPTMFRHEISRALGGDVCEGIEGTFLDFLCCFKFELHDQIILMEPSIQQGQQLLCIKPRTVLLKWIESTESDELPETTQVLERVNLSHLAENSTVLVKNFNHPSEIKPFIKHYYRPIFKAELFRLGTKAEQWPTIDSFQMFRRYFVVDIHTQLVHLY